jgi:D-beta-D-heptose 7-phosphate kinase/D-beta-D-heptose 1-phosphate adenosyltransferase
MKKIWTNGCFDILHIGHIRLFEYAKSLGDYLLIGIDSDDRVKKLKGNNRPVNNQYDRKAFLESIKYVDEVIIFNSSDELCYNIKKFNIDTIVVGDDYKEKTVIGSEHSNVIFFPKIPDKSTTHLVKQLL